jgi:hypothetical protein
MVSGTTTPYAPERQRWRITAKAYGVFGTVELLAHGVRCPGVHTSAAGRATAAGPFRRFLILFLEPPTPSRPISNC